MIKQLLWASTALGPMALLAPTSLAAQQATSTTTPAATDQGVGEIIVTANRRAENLQQVPISVVAFKGEALKTQGIQSVVDLPQLTPGLGFTRTLVGTNAFLRGVGTTTAGYSTEVPIATYIDGLYLPNSAASSFSFNNIERIEVLKGPQGTLYGRNTTGGLINVITKSPGDVASVDASASYGNYNTTQLNFYGSTPLSETLAANFAALYIDQADGWGKNLFTGRKVYTLNDLGFQGKLLWKPNADARVELRGFYDRTKSDEGDAVAEFPGEVGTDGSVFPGQYNINSRLTPFVTQRQYSLSLKAEHKFSFATLSSLTGYINNHSTSLQTQGPVLGQVAPGQSTINLGAFQTARTLSEELQLTSRGTGPFQWIVGAFFYDDKTMIQTNVSGTCIAGVCSPGFTNATATTTGYQRTKSYAGYAEGTYAIRPSTRITLGIRYTSDEKVFTGNVVPLAGLPNSFTGAVLPAPPFYTAPLVPTDITYAKPTWRIVAAQDLADDIHAYVSYNRGFKSGGFNPTSLTNPASRPEVLDDYEIGVKSQLFDNKLRLNLAAFYYNYRDIQLRSTAPPAPPGASFLYNAASSRNYGLDADFVFVPVHNLTFSGGFEILDAHYRNFPGGIITTLRPISANGTGGTVSSSGNLAGFQLPQAPNVSFSIGASYVIPSSIGEFELNANDGYKSSFAFESDNRLRQPAYHLVNASLTFRPTDSRFSLQLFGKNLNGVYYFTSVANGGNNDGYLPGAPRTYGIRARYNF